MTDRLVALAARFDALEAAIAALKASSFQNAAAALHPRPAPAAASLKELEPCAQDTPEVAKLRELCRTLPLSSAVFRWVPSDYYSWPLQKRRDILSAPSVDYLCKAIVLENTHCEFSDCSNRENSRFYIVMFQYVEKFDSEKLMRFVKGMNPSLGKKKFNFRLADPEVSKQLTGFGYNAVVPFGGAVDVPIILSEKVRQLAAGYFWMGGGHVDCKLRADCSEFVERFHPFVADVTNPLSEDELNAITD